MRVAAAAQLRTARLRRPSLVHAVFIAGVVSAAAVAAKARQRNAAVQSSPLRGGLREERRRTALCRVLRAALRHCHENLLLWCGDADLSEELVDWITAALQSILGGSHCARCWQSIVQAVRGWGRRH